MNERERSAKNDIVAPRIFNDQRPGSGWTKGLPRTIADAHAWVAWAHENGIDGIKFGRETLQILPAAL